MSDRVTIFDTTLRDGEQSPGCSMTTPEKLEVARALVELGVDVIEAGFPIASPGDFEAVRDIAREFGTSATICGLARCRELDVKRAGEAIADAERKRIHVFLATSAIHREHKLRMDKSTIIETAVEMVRLAKTFTDDIEFSPEDAVRTELDFLSEVVERAIDAGATTVNIPDTVGYATPSQYYDVISHLRSNVPNIDRAVISVHCHNDLGMAVANSLAGVQAGARQIECTINGLGERAGNAALEEIVMALRTRSDYFGVTTDINTRRLHPTSALVSRMTGMQVQRNKAIVGQNAFAHESGIHQDGMLKNPSTYEIMRPEDVGFPGTNLVLGKHSGRHAFRSRLQALGIELDADAMQQVFDDFIALADKKKEIYDADLVALVDQRSQAVPERWSLKSLHYSSGTGSIPTATIELALEDGTVYCDAATGDGPVDAVFRTLERIVEVSASLERYEVRSVSRGKDALGEVAVELDLNGRSYHGTGVSTDIIEASARAYLKALNRADHDRTARANGDESEANERVEEPTP